MTTPKTDSPNVRAHERAHAPRAALALAALGVVYGDIGTSPLYTLRECVAGEHGVGVDRGSLMGVLSLIFWSLTVVVTLKYLVFVMMADNRGEGGIFALLALILESRDGANAPSSSRRGLPWVAVLVIVGAALLYGDGVITPAISVLSAIEGLEVAAPGVKRAVIPLTCLVLLGLFSVQRRGTAGIGKIFGPVMLVWFLTLGAIGGYQIAKYPAVLSALAPHHAVLFFVHHGVRGIFVLGSVVLAVTGGEALYADMGHFGRQPIRIAWLLVAMPALVVAYFGQGALLLSDPSALHNPFFAMVPRGPCTYALVALATLATVIASQALISGAFSLTHQAVQLGFFPRVTVKHTSREAEGQIYLPEVNWGLAVACLALVVTFKESSRLAAAYGIAVCGTMAITSVVYFVVTRVTWKWSLARALPLLILFLAFDIPFFVANILKFFDGGYVPIFIAAGFILVMVTWKRGRSLLRERTEQQAPLVEEFIASIQKLGVSRSKRCAVFLTPDGRRVSPMMSHHVERVGVLPEHVILFSVVVAHRPAVAIEERFRVEDLGQGFYRLVAQFGFMERPHLPKVLADAVEQNHLPINLKGLTYFVGRETFLASKEGQMGAFSETLFAILSRNAKSATAYFSLPPEQVIEIGSQIDL